MKIDRFVGGEIEANCYVIYYSEGGDCLIVDPGFNGADIIEHVRNKGLTAKGLLLTHFHDDHSGCANMLRDELCSPIYMSEQDNRFFDGYVEFPFSDGDVIELEGRKIKALLTPGHTWGSTSFLMEDEKVCFTGDFIFDHRLGRSEFLSGSEDDMIRSVREISEKWADDIMLYPGHYECAPMSEIRSRNQDYIDLRDGVVRERYR